MRRVAVPIHHPDGRRAPLSRPLLCAFLLTFGSAEAAPRRAADLIDLVGMPVRPADEAQPGPRPLQPLQRVQPAPERPDAGPARFVAPASAAAQVPAKPVPPQATVPLPPPRPPVQAAKPAAAPPLAENPAPPPFPAMTMREDIAVIPPAIPPQFEATVDRPPAAPVPQPASAAAKETATHAPLRRNVAPSFSPAAISAQAQTSSPQPVQVAAPQPLPPTIHADDLITTGAVPTTRIAYVVRAQALEHVLRELGQLAGVSIVAGSGLKADVRERRLDGTLERILDQLAREFGLFWFHDGMTIYVDPLDQQRTRAFRVKGGTRASIARALEAAGLGRYQDRIQFSGNDGYVRVSGPESFARAVETALASSEPERTTINVIRAGMKGH